MSILRVLEEGHKRELLQQKLLFDEKLQGEQGKIRNAYWRGYGEAQADIFAAIQKEPDMYHEFIERHRAGEIPPLTWANVDKYVQALKVKSKN